VEEVSGQPLVPVVDFDGEIVFDSTRILQRLEELYPEPPLFPTDPSVRAEVDIFLEWFDGVWKGPPNQIEAELGGLPDHDAALIERLGGRMSGWLDLFERMLDGRDHLFGEFGAADCAAYPFVKYAAGRDPADDELFHQILDRHQTVEGKPRLAAWIERVSLRPQA
jgi:glutathione S-transferase